MARSFRTTISMARSEPWKGSAIRENGPKHADAWASFEDQDGATKVTLGMIFSTVAEFQEAKGFGALELGCKLLASWSAS